MELVKVDPENLSLDPCQKEVSRNLLRECLNLVVEDCVHFVGVDVNRSSKHLLKYVSGIGSDLAGKIVCYREDKGFLKSRDELSEFQDGLPERMSRPRVF